MLSDDVRRQRRERRAEAPSDSDRPRRASRQPGRIAEHDLPAQILAVLSAPRYQPLDKVQLTRELGLGSSERRKIREVLAELEREGQIVRIRKDRYALPDAAQLVTGRIEFHRNGSAHIVNERAGHADLFIRPEHTNTALHGDRVVARPDGHGEGTRLEGRVIRILERGTARIVGTLKKTPHFFYVAPDDARMPHDIYVEKTPAATLGDKVVVRLDAWENRHVNPEGTIIEVLGPAGAPGVDMLAIIRKHDLPLRFPDAVLAEADRIPEEIDPEELARREDCRATPIITIDPDDAKDFDDAIYVERTSGGWKLQVHIADVAHYVKPGTALDREAYARGNSTYLADRVIPMLPERLSNGICSLKPKVERCTFAAFLDFDQEGRLARARFAKAVIKSAARLTYREAFARLSQPPSDWLGERLHTAWSLASLLRKKRFAAGSLDLDMPEIKVRLDERGWPIALERVENDISHQLIEEFMLAANEAVARELKNRRVPTVYRVHEKPDPDRLREFREIASAYGLRMGNPEVRGELQRILKQVRGHAEEHAIKVALLRRMMRARYDVAPLGHYGLAKTNYTHFTSPIRRYADLLVHRGLASLRGGSGGGAALDSREMSKTAAHISQTERISAEAEGDSVAVKKMEFFERQLHARKPDDFRAIVTEVRSYGLVIDLPDAGQSGIIHVSALGDEFFQYDSARSCFFSRRSRKRFGLGDELRVIVARVDRMKRQVDFAPA